MTDSGRVNSRRGVNQRCISRSDGETRPTLFGAFDKANAYSLRGEWICRDCNTTCLVIREECRCLCGHRLKEHTNIRKKTLHKDRDAYDNTETPWCYKCVHPKCKCNHFFYIVGEGAWILRCRCKHKHIEHDPVSYKCTKAQCKCSRFDSPWVCNCNHPWSAHVQRMGMQRRPEDVESQLGEFSEIAREVNNLKGLRRDPLHTEETDKKVPTLYPREGGPNSTVARRPSSTEKLAVLAR